MKKILVLIVMLFCCQSAFAETITPEKKALIDKLLEQTGQSALQVGTQFSDAFLQQMTAVLKNSNPDIDPRAFSIMEEVVRDTINEEIVVGNRLAEMMYPIYAKHFTAEELKQLIELNNTPIGKKAIKVMPLIAQEGMQAGQQLGQSLGPKIQNRLVARFEEEGIQ